MLLSGGSRDEGNSRFIIGVFVSVALGLALVLIVAAIIYFRKNPEKWKKLSKRLCRRDPTTEAAIQHEEKAPMVDEEVRLGSSIQYDGGQKQNFIRHGSLVVRPQVPSTSNSVNPTMNTDNSSSFYLPNETPRGSDVVFPNKLLDNVICEYAEEATSEPHIEGVRDGCAMTCSPSPSLSAGQQEGETLVKVLPVQGYSPGELLFNVDYNGILQHINYKICL